MPRHEIHAAKHAAQLVLKRVVGGVIAMQPRVNRRHWLRQKHSGQNDDPVILRSKILPASVVGVGFELKSCPLACLLPA
jgi:hypothetical protein